MKKIIVFIIVQTCINNLSYSQLANGSFTQFNNCTVPTVGTCASFDASCVTNWMSAYGTPQILSEIVTPKRITNYFGYMWSNDTGCSGEGMFAGYNIQANTTYKLTIDASATDLSGSMNILLTNGLTHLVRDDGICGDNHRAVASSQNILLYIPNQNNLFENKQTAIPSTWTSYSYPFVSNSIYSQVYIYPCASSSTQYNLNIDNLNVVFDCAGVITYNNGIVPLNKSKAGYINVGSTAGTGGSGTVTNSSINNTYLIASNYIKFVPGFHATVGVGGIFSAKAVDCGSILAARPLLGQNKDNNSKRDQNIVNKKTEQEKYSDSLNYTNKLLQIKEKGNIFIYPNPVNEKLNLIINNFNTSRIKISIIDISGKTYYSVNKIISNNSDNNIEISTSTLTKGSYFIKVSNGTTSFIQPFEK